MNVDKVIIKYLLFIDLESYWILYSIIASFDVVYNHANPADQKSSNETNVSEYSLSSKNNLNMLMKQVSDLKYSALDHLLLYTPLITTG